LDEVYRAPFEGKGQNGPYTVKGPWQTHTKRMNRHKSWIQCARLAFGFAGIYDEDEAQRIIERDITSQSAVVERTALRDQVQRKSEKTEEHRETIEGESTVETSESAPTLESLLQMLVEAKSPDDIDLASSLAKEHLKGAGLKAFDGAAKNRVAEIQEQQA
jgi:hypothetical protein